MSFRTFGTLSYEPTTQRWVINHIEPHVAIALKGVFRRIRATDTTPFTLSDSLDICADLLWFTQRYPLKISPADQRLLKSRDRMYRKETSERETIFTRQITQKPDLDLTGITPRQYQLQAAEFLISTKRFLLADTQGLGKTLTAILSMLYANTWPAAVIMDAQLVLQWRDVIEKHTSLRVHIVKQTKPYALPEADVYLFKYTLLSGWVDVVKQCPFDFVVFDEIASLRHGKKTDKGDAASVFSDHATYVMGLSGTPIYNYGAEIFNIIHNYIRPDCLGSIMEFNREWCEGHDNKVIRDPKALGAYLREIHVMLRRTKKEVFGTDKLPHVEVHEVGYDEKEAQSFEQLMKTLAISSLGQDGLNNQFQDSGQFSLKLRQLTGIVKAKQVAMYVRLLVESGEPVILAAWHREVYDIYLSELRDLNPLMFTGTESVSAKEKSKQAFISGESNLLILSLRSGIGIDGLQSRCAYMVFGEMDYSPQIHAQVITRIDRPGQARDVTVLFLICQFGSDPVIQELLGLKRAQSDGIMDPFNDSLQSVGSLREIDSQSRIKLLAQDYLKRQGVILPDLGERKAS